MVKNIKHKKIKIKTITFIFGFRLDHLPTKYTKAFVLALDQSLEGTSGKKKIIKKKFKMKN